MKRIFCSFSGGETSGYMAKFIADNYRDKYEVVFGFANTGQEHEKTLEFVNQCDKAWGLSLIWIEAVIVPGDRKGTRHKVVDFQTADRNGKVFESSIAKYGIPNSSYPNCNRELKLHAMTSYLRSIGWKSRSYTTAIGIRADEFDRMDENRKKKKFWYPLVEKNITKSAVKDWWKEQSFNLGLSEHQGNCKWCWKKSDRKLLTLAKESPEIFDFPLRMEEKYSHVKAPHGRRVFFRDERATADLINLASEPFTPFIETNPPTQLQLDVSNGCNESCEPY